VVMGYYTIREESGPVYKKITLGEISLQKLDINLESERDRV